MSALSLSAEAAARVAAIREMMGQIGPHGMISQSPVRFLLEQIDVLLAASAPAPVASRLDLFAAAAQIMAGYRARLPYDDMDSEDLARLALCDAEALLAESDRRRRAAPEAGRGEAE